LKLRAIVEGRKSRSVFDRRLDLTGNDGWLEEFRAPMNYPMSNHIDIVRTGNSVRLTAPQTMEQPLYGLLARSGGRDVSYRGSGGVLDRVVCLVIHPFNFAFPKARRRTLREMVADFEEAAFLAAGAGIENEHLHQ
jgi:hypothetical protein